MRRAGKHQRLWSVLAVVALVAAIAALRDRHLAHGGGRPPGAAGGHLARCRRRVRHDRRGGDRRPAGRLDARRPRRLPRADGPPVGHHRSGGGGAGRPPPACTSGAWTAISVVVDGTEARRAAVQRAPGDQDLGPTMDGTSSSGRNGVDGVRRPTASPSTTSRRATSSPATAAAGNEIWWNGGDGTGTQEHERLRGPLSVGHLDATTRTATPTPSTASS